MAIPLSNVDTDMLWPPVSARYNIDLGELFKIAATEKNSDTFHDCAQHVSIYLDALIYADDLWGRQILDSLLATGRGDAIKAIAVSMGESLASCVGVNPTLLHRSISKLVKKEGNPYVALGHNQLAAAMIYLAWNSHDVESAMTKLDYYRNVIDHAVTTNNLTFPHPLFTTLVKKSFNPMNVQVIKREKNGIALSVPS